MKAAVAAIVLAVTAGGDCVSFVATGGKNEPGKNR